jgi:hypothetical protein
MKKQKKQAGFIVSAELVLVATILVIGMVVGMAIVRDAVTAEMEDVAEAIGALDQSYNYAGITITSPGGTLAIVAGSEWNDSVDDQAGDGIFATYVSPVADGEASFF